MLYVLKKLDIGVAINLTRVALSTQSSVIRLSLFYRVVLVTTYSLVNLTVNRWSGIIQKLAALLSLYKKGIS